ncbi:PE-PPE domain-containing protein [Mycolicibacterium sp. XJ870]
MAATGGTVQKFAMVGAAAAMAASLTVGIGAQPVPDAQAATGVFTTGPVFRVLDALGVDIEGLLPAEVQAIFDALGVEIENVPAHSVDINNAINGVGFTLNSRAAVVLGFGLGSSATTQAYQALIESAQGNTREGYDPLLPGSQLFPRRTNMVLVLLRNPGRPNGGLGARFAPVAELFGIDPVTPPGGRTPGTVPGIGLNTTTIDVTWAYDVMSDAPVTLNPVSWANSIAASILLTNLLGGVEVAGDDTDGILTNIAGVITGLTAGQSYYVTLVPNDLALLEPMRLPVRVINAVTGWDLDTPLADAIQPAVQILVDIGYPDVVREADGTYHRTYDTAGVPTPLLSEFPLDSPAAYLQVPVDVARALVRGFRDEFLPGQPEPEDTAPELDAPLSITADLGTDVGQAEELVEESVVEVAKKPVRNELRDSTTQVRNRVQDAVKDARSQTRNAVKGLRDQMDKVTDDVRSAVKKANRGTKAGTKDDDGDGGDTEDKAASSTESNAGDDD